MDYYLYNTDEDAIVGLPRRRFQRLLEGSFAAIGGDPKRYGEQLRQLEPNDMLLMYQNGTGIVAVGRVQKHWDGKSHKNPRYYNISELPSLDGGPWEYRIAVDWLHDWSDRPVRVQEVRKRLGYIPRGAVKKIVKRHSEAAALVEEHTLRFTASLRDDEGDRDSVDGIEYTPNDVDERKIERQIRERRGRQRFRNGLMKRYGASCLISGCSVKDVLEAAHIRPYRGVNDNHAKNGLLLRADIHTLFDLNLLAIETNHLVVELHPVLALDESYTKLAGKSLRCKPNQQPSQSALLERYKQFKSRLART